MTIRFKKVIKVAAALAAVLLLLAMAGCGALVMHFRSEEKKFTALEDTRDLEQRIAVLAEPYAKKRPNATVTIGVWQKGRRHVAAFGATGETEPGRIIYEIGSITKVFTAILLAQAEAEGLVALDDPIGPLLPAKENIPADIGAITLKQLAMHRSGLPRLPENLDGAAQDGDNPYAHYRAAELYDCLRTVKLTRGAGDQYQYSNLGAGLLGHGLALKWGKPYEALVAEKITGPLGMTDTVFALNDEQDARFLDGYGLFKSPAAHWDFDVLAPAGGLRSTADDMLAFIGANMIAAAAPKIEGVTPDPDTSPNFTTPQTVSAPSDLIPALRRARELHTPADSSDLMGLGWQVRTDSLSGISMRWHNGGTGGFSTFIATDARQQIGVVVLSNQFDFWGGVDRLGVKVLRLASKVSLAAE